MHVPHVPFLGDGGETKLGGETIESAPQHIVLEAGHDNGSSGELGSSAVRVLTRHVGFVIGPPAHEAGDQADKAANTAKTESPDHDVDFVGNAENGEELGDKGQAEGTEPEVATDLVDELPVVGVAEDITLVVVVRG